MAQAGLWDCAALSGYINYNYELSKRCIYLTNNVASLFRCSMQLKIFLSGLVEISPLVVAPVCQAGDQLELTCSTSGQLHSWQLIANPDSGATTSLRSVSSLGSTGVDAEPVVINSVMFTFSRLSGPSSSLLISRMTVSGVSQSLNGSQVRCAMASDDESAMTTILIIGGKCDSQKHFLVT